MGVEPNTRRGRRIMSIRIKDLTPDKSVLEMMKINDIYGGVIVVKGWR